MRKAADLPNPNPVRLGPGPEERLRNLQRRFRAVSKRHERASGLRRYYRSIKIAALTAIVAFAVVWGLRSTISWHDPNLYLFLGLLTGLAAVLAISECVQKFRRRKPPVVEWKCLTVNKTAGDSLSSSTMKYVNPPSPFSRLCESMKDVPPKEQASRVRKHFGIFGGARPKPRSNRLRAVEPDRAGEF